MSDKDEATACVKCGCPARSYGNVRYATCHSIGNRLCDCVCIFPSAGDVEAVVELMPCPFCGSVQVAAVDTLDEDSRWCATCIVCQAGTAFYVVRTAAIEAWNRRVSPAKEQELANGEKDTVAPSTAEMETHLTLNADRPGDPELRDCADGVAGHYCVGRLIRHNEPYFEFWNNGVWRSAGEVFIGKDRARVQLALIRAYEALSCATTPPQSEQESELEECLRMENESLRAELAQVYGRELRDGKPSAAEEELASIKTILDWFIRQIEAIPTPDPLDLKQVAAAYDELVSTCKRAAGMARLAKSKGEEEQNLAVPPGQSIKDIPVDADPGDFGMCPHKPCSRIWANEMLRDDKRVPTHDFPEPCRAVCPGSGQFPIPATQATGGLPTQDVPDVLAPETECSIYGERKEVVRVASVNESGTRIEHLANLMLIDDFNRRVRKYKRKVKRDGTT